MEKRRSRRQTKPDIKKESWEERIGFKEFYVKIDSEQSEIHEAVVNVKFLAKSAL